MKSCLVFGGLLACVASSWVCAAEKNTPAEWPQWRGPNRDGISADTGLLKAWPKEGPKLLWEARGAGGGYSSLAVANGKVYTLGDAPSTAEDKDEYVVCLNAADGKQAWRTKVGPSFTEQRNPNWTGARSTPTVDGELLYTIAPQGEIICHETAGGKERWRKNLKKDFGGRKGDGWGYSESALVDGDQVVCTPGGEDATMVALNKRTGEVIWKAAVPEDRGSGHASIVVATVNGTRCYVQTTASFAFGVNAKDGKLLWTYAIPRTTAVVPTPIVRGDLAFIDAGYNTGGALLKLVPEGSGLKAEQVYGFKPPLNNKHGGIVLVGDYLYGDTNDSGMPFCADLKTGEVKWKKRGSGSQSAAVSYADGHLYIRFASGQMVLAKASPDDYQEVGSFKIPHSGSKPSWSHPVIVGGRLYLREQDYILCYDVREARSP
jgi:outer membrane protein assembly factor BamB